MQHIAFWFMALFVLVASQDILDSLFDIKSEDDLETEQSSLETETVKDPQETETEQEPQTEEERRSKKESKIIKALTAQLAAPAVLTNSKIAGLAGAIPPVMAAKGALFGALVAQPLVDSAVGKSGAASALSGFSVALPFAIRRTMKKKLANNKESLFKMVGTLQTLGDDFHDGMRDNLPGDRNQSQHLNLRPLVIVANPVPVEQLHTGCEIQQGCIIPVNADDSYNEYVVDNEHGPEELNMNATEENAQIGETHPTDGTSVEVNRAKREARLSPEEQTQLLDLISSLKMEDCVRRLVCELNCNSDSHGDAGKKVLSTFMRMQLNMKNSISSIAPYTKAGVEGKRLRMYNDCTKCTSSYPTCNAKSSGLVMIISKVDV